MDRDEMTGSAARRSQVRALRHPVDDASIFARIIAAQNEIASAAGDPTQVIAVVVRRAQELTRSAGAIVEIMDGGDMVYLAASGTAEPQIGLRLSAASSLSGLCVRQAKVLWCDDAEYDPRVDLAACRKVGLRSMLVAPLIFENQPIGVLKVISPQASAYRETDVRTLEMMAALIGATLGHSIRHSGLLQRYQARMAAEESATEEQDSSKRRIGRLITDHALQTVFQPVVRLSDRRVVSVEALTRFPDTALSPDRWFALATDVGLGLELEVEAARNALAHLDQLPAPMRLSINASPETAVSEAFRVLLNGHDLRRVAVEITEHSTVTDYDLLYRRLTALQQQGLWVAIDDAGAGFASLRHILHLVPDVIKLDISLTRKIDSDTRRQTMVSAILAFATGTQATVVVEGIETESELNTLVGLGVAYGQGYYLCPPVTLEQALASQEGRRG